MKTAQNQAIKSNSVRQCLLSAAMLDGIRRLVHDSCALHPILQHFFVFNASDDETDFFAFYLNYVGLRLFGNEDAARDICDQPIKHICLSEKNRRIENEVMHCTTMYDKGHGMTMRR